MGGKFLRQKLNMPWKFIYSLIIKELHECTKKQNEELNPTTDIAEEPQNMSKNRFGDILAYDHSRVKIVTVDSDEPNDYINANYIPVIFNFNNFSLTSLYI